MANVVSTRVANRRPSIPATPKDNALPLTFKVQGKYTTLPAIQRFFDELTRLG